MTEEKEEITVGDSVKIRLMGNGHMERIWATVLGVDVEKQELLVELDNHPVNPGFKYKEQLQIPVSYVLDKYQPTEGGE